VFEDKQKRRAALVGLALVGVIVVGALAGSRSVADDLRPKALGALSTAGLGDIVVDFDGREARLSGGTSDDLARAETIVEGVRGVRWATVDPGGVVAAPTVATVTLRRTSEGLEISGTVPSADAALGLKSSAAETFGLTVSGDLAMDPSVGSAAWTDDLPTVFGDVLGVEGLVLKVDGDTLHIRGSVETEAIAILVKDLVETDVPDLEVVSAISFEEN
jgi:hypothetical protein